MESTNCSSAQTTYIDEIDPREVWHALARRKHFAAGGLIIGLTLSGFSSLYQPAPIKQYIAAVTFNIADEPNSAEPDKKFILNAPQDKPLTKGNYSFYFSALTRELYSIRRTQMADKITRLMQVYIPQNQLKDWKLTQTSVNIGSPEGQNESIDVDGSLSLKNESFTSELNAQKSTEYLNKLAQAVTNESSSIYQEDGTGGASFKISATPITIQSTTKINPKKSLTKILTLGGFAGLAAGAGLGLFADRQNKIEYSKEQLKRFLPYTTALEIPLAPWSNFTVQTASGILLSSLDPSKTWLLTSIGSSHPAVSLLQEAVMKQDSDVNITIQAPLLSHSLPRYHDLSKKGILVVVEPGFNTRPALKQAQQLLSQLPPTVEVRLVMVGTPTPKECSPN